MKLRCGPFAILIAAILGCSGPKLYVQLEEKSFNDTTLVYEATLSNSSGNWLCKGTAARGPIILQAWSARTTDLLNDPSRRVQGGWTVVLAGETLAPGASVTRRFATGNPLIPGRDVYLIVQAYTGDAQPEYPNPATHDKNAGCARLVVEGTLPVPYH